MGSYNREWQTEIGDVIKRISTGILYIVTTYLIESSQGFQLSPQQIGKRIHKVPKTVQSGYEVNFMLRNTMMKIHLKLKVADIIVFSLFQFYITPLKMTVGFHIPTSDHVFMRICLSSYVILF